MRKEVPHRGTSLYSPNPFSTARTSDFSASCSSSPSQKNSISSPLFTQAPSTLSTLLALAVLSRNWNVYKSFINTKDFLPYYDLKISDEAYCSMEITLSPQFSDGNRVILESLCEKYNLNMRISESALRNRVRL